MKVSKNIIAILSHCFKAHHPDQIQEKLNRVYVFTLLYKNIKGDEVTSQGGNNIYLERERIKRLNEARTPIALTDGDGSAFSSSL